MKRSTKNLLRAALICFIIGAAFGISSLCTGFRWTDFQRAVENGQFTLAGAHVDAVTSRILDISESGRSYDETFTGVEKLKLDLGTADCRLVVRDGDEWSVTGENLSSAFACSQKGGELEIRAGSRWTFFGIGSRKATLEICIPANQELEKVEIDGGVGDLEMEDGFLRCREMEIDSAVGDFTVRADITRKLELDGGVGDLCLILKGDREDFNFDIDGGIGDLDIGDSHHSGLGATEKYDNHASKDIIVDNGVGDITIKFER